MDRFYDLIPHDKALHALFGIPVALIAAFVASQYAFAPWIAALCASTALGVGYEAYQLRKRAGTVSIYDALATAAGGVPVALATLI